MSWSWTDLIPELDKRGIIPDSVTAQMILKILECATPVEAADKLEKIIKGEIK
jgi:hypothetical protein